MHLQWIPCLKINLKNTLLQVFPLNLKVDPRGRMTWQFLNGLELFSS